MKGKGKHYYESGTVIYQTPAIYSQYINIVNLIWSLLGDNELEMYVWFYFSSSKHWTDVHHNKNILAIPDLWQRENMWLQEITNKNNSLLHQELLPIETLRKNQISKL